MLGWQVSWAMQTGLYEHPELYEGLTEHSLFEDFQDYIRDVTESAACRAQRRVQE